jgi:hypothetical protein
MTDMGPQDDLGRTWPQDAAPAAPGAPGQFPGYLVTVGDIGVTNDLVVTPNGQGPLRGSQWMVNDMSRTDTRIPVWAIVLAIVFALLCLLGLLFLLAKEPVTTGYVQVTVRTGGLVHMTQIPVSDPQQVMWVRQQVAHAQTLASRA